MAAGVSDRAILIGGGLALAVVGLYVWKKGGIAPAAQAAGAAAVEVVGGVASGAVGAVGGAVGLPAPSQTTTDERVARWLIDNVGHFEASKWSGAGVYLSALFEPPGSGTPPDPASDVGRRFAAELAFYRSGAPDTGDELDRMLAQRPAPAATGGTGGAESVFGGVVRWFGDAWDEVQRLAR